MQNHDTLKIEGTAYWFSFLEKNEMSDKYQVDISELSEAQVDRLESMGINVKNKGDDRGYFVTAKAVKYAPRVDDADGFKMTDPVGNGSKCTFIVRPYDYNFRGKSGVALGISKARVNELVRFESADTDYDDIPSL
jgi:hypothetical protein